MSDQPIAEAATYTTPKKHNEKISIKSTGFEPAILIIKQLYTCAFESTAAGIIYSAV
jgi:hypothetical protein